MAEKIVLVVDDEPGVVNVIKLHLERKGYKVFTAYDGEEGLRQAKELKPGLILLDVNMPKKGGLEFFSDILVSDNQKMFPVLVLTGRTEFETLFKDMSADGFVPKPIDFQKLLEEVDKIFAKYDRSKITARSVLIVEDNDEALDRIVVPFVRAKFTVTCVKTVEDVSGQAPAEPFNLVISKLSLCDIIADLRRMPKFITKETAVLLYAPQGSDLDKEVVKKLCEKSGVTPGELMRTDNAYDLLKKSKEALGLDARG